MNNRYLIVIGVLGVIAVILGAFGAHSLSSVISEKSLSTFKTGISYHFYHTLAIFGTVSFLSKSNQNIFLKRAVLLFTIGIILFSGSLYFLACSKLLGIEHLNKIIGPITPIGGLALIAGWGLLIFAGFKEMNYKDD